MAKTFGYCETQEERENAAKWMVFPYEYAQENARNHLATCHPGMRAHWQHVIDNYEQLLIGNRAIAASILKNGY